MYDNRGSIWRKWDLHVHTPESYQHQFGNDWDVYVNHLKGKAVLHDVEVVGITDYFSIDGYEVLKNKYCNGDNKLMLSNGKTLNIIPCIELRIESFDQSGASINIHIAFDPKVGPTTIRTLFLEELKVKYQDHELSIKRENLIKVGYSLSKSETFNFNLDIQRINEDDQKKYIRNALNVITIPIENMKILLESLRKTLKQSGINSDCYLIMAAYKGHGSLSNLPWSDESKQLGRLGNLRLSLMNNVDICFSSHENDRNYLLGKSEHMSANDIIRRFGSLKPCIWGSDSHNLNTLFHPSNGTSEKYTWIKADPCFDGLKQIINEPEQRVFIGTKPNKVINTEQNKTKYLKSIEIKKKNESSLDEIWFDNKLDFNPGLVALIGNKGSGKSALADILGLMGETKQQEYFSFLNDKRFKQKKDNKAAHFNATLIWQDDFETNKSLDSTINENAIERVRYIPQNYFEQICNEMAEGEKSQFYNEVKKVIFSYIKENERLKQADLDTLINFKTKETKEHIKLLREDLEKINKEIIDLEYQVSEKNKKTLENQLILKKQELESHQTLKPVEVVKPNTNKQLEDKLGNLQSELKQVINKIEQTEKQIGNEELIISVCENVVEKIENLETRIEAIKKEWENDLSLIGVEFSELITLTTNKSPIELKIDAAKKARESLSILLDPNMPESLLQKKATIEEEIKKHKDELDGPSKKYQHYVTELESWNERRIKIIGYDDIPDTLSYYEKRIRNINEIPAILEEIQTKRNSKVKEIYEFISKTVNMYKQLYAPIQAAISDNQILKESLKLSFEVSVTMNTDFLETFLSKFNRKAKGTFSGIEEGNRALKSIIERHDYNNLEGVFNFLSDLMEHLIYDKRKEKIVKVEIEEQLKSGGDLLSLYEYIFSLTYLEPKYLMKLNGKELSELSPGERGILLLIFYLLLEKDDVPLIIDQPEDNLDNQTVYNLLVPCIREAKNYRQIFIVTHNPNLAVVCDAEQVIYASIDKANKNLLIYEAGSIENIKINKCIIDVLEGTRPAFNNRDSKYLPEVLTV
jgi:ABC-type lipoprotein export system ATPase subunit/predicted nucleotidyltransferase